MPTISYPSALVPAPPRIRLDVPDGWEQLVLPETLIAARETGVPEGHFAANVTVRNLVRPAEITEASLLAELREFAAAKEQGVISEPFVRLTNGRSTFSDRLHGANLSYVDPAAGTLGQVHVFARRVEGVRASIVQVVASFSGDRAEQLSPVVRAIVASLEIE